MIKEIVESCEREISNKTQSSALAKEILEIIEQYEESPCECNDEFDEDIEERIIDYVSRQGDCLPESVTLVSDEECAVYKVTVKEYSKAWEVPPPDFWYVCIKPFMNLYRNDTFLPRPWINDGQEESSVIDFVKSFHIGLCFRVSTKQDEIENGTHH